MKPDLREAAKQVLAWWAQKIDNELSSNRDFPWAEEAEWKEFHALRLAVQYEEETSL